MSKLQKEPIEVKDGRIRANQHVSLGDILMAREGRRESRERVVELIPTGTEYPTEFKTIRRKPGDSGRKDVKYVVVTKYEGSVPMGFTRKESVAIQKGHPMFGDYNTKLNELLV